MKVLKLAKNISNKKWFFWSSLIAEQEGSKRKTLLCWSFVEQLLFSFFFASMASKEILLLEEMLFVLIEWWLCKSYSHQRSLHVWKLIQFLREEIFIHHLNFWAAKARKSDSCCMLARKLICSSSVHTHHKKVCEIPISTIILLMGKVANWATF